MFRYYHCTVNILHYNDGSVLSLHCKLGYFNISKEAIGCTASVVHFVTLKITYSSFSKGIQLWLIMIQTMCNSPGKRGTVRSRVLRNEIVRFFAKKFRFLQNCNEQKMNFTVRKIRILPDILQKYVRVNSGWKALNFRRGLVASALTSSDTAHSGFIERGGGATDIIPPSLTHSLALSSANRG